MRQQSSVISGHFRERLFLVRRPRSRTSIWTLFSIIWLQGVLFNVNSIYDETRLCAQCTLTRKWDDRPAKYSNNGHHPLHHMWTGMNSVDWCRPLFHFNAKKYTYLLLTVMYAGMQIVHLWPSLYNLCFGVEEGQCWICWTHNLRIGILTGGGFGAHIWNCPAI